MAVLNMKIRSSVLNMETEVAVYFPESRDNKIEELNPDKKYPVIYCLHGYRESYEAWLTKGTIELEARKHDCIIVMPNCKNSFYVNGQNGFDYYDFVCKELPIKIANMFPISLRREDTFIMGASMGGYGAFLFAMTNPDKYAAAFSFSGALAFEYDNGRPFTFDPRMSKQVYGALGEEDNYLANYNLFNLAKRLDSSDCVKPKFKAVCGTSDPLCFKYNEDFYRFIKENTSLSYEYETGDGEHDYFFWNKYIDSAFKFFGV